MSAMKDQISTILNRVRSWPEERQEDAAEILRLIEEHDRSPYHLSDQQVAEVRRRLTQANPKALTLGQLDERLRLLGV
jgi:hypothetical protein